MATWTFNRERRNEGISTTIFTGTTGRGILAILRACFATASSGGAVVAFDMDGDGDLDIFRPDKSSTAPILPRHGAIFFENTNGVFRDITPDFLQHIALSIRALVADVNRDASDDLILAGEFHARYDCIWPAEGSFFYGG